MREREVLRAYPWRELVEARRDMADLVTAAVADGVELNVQYVSRYRAIVGELERRRSAVENGDERV